MKKLYILILMVFTAGMSLAQDVDFESFQFRLVAPGPSDGSGIFRVQMRAVLPTDLPTTGDVCSELAWKIWWSNSSIMDITVQSSIFSFVLEAPVTENNSDNGLPGNAVAVAIATTAAFPTNWELNKWQQIATFNICSNPDCSPAGAPTGITASSFHIQGFDEISLPVFQMNGGNNTYYIPLNTGPLPLNLISFTAQKSGERDAHLTWTTANEENTSHFIVQRSFDKTNWTEIGSVPAAGYSTIIRNYELTDLEVNDGRANRVRPYYRLVMVDRDGRSTISPIESLIFTNSTLTEANSFEVFPNPASDGVYVTWDEANIDQPTLLEFYDITGKLVYRQTVSDKSDQEYIDFGPSKMQSGVYMLRILNGAETLDHKQIVVSQRK